MAEADNDPAGDRPIIVGGGPLHITMQLPHPSEEKRSKKQDYGPKSFSLVPKDPAVPFKEILLTNGDKEVLRWPLSENWKITIR